MAAFCLLTFHLTPSEYSKIVKKIFFLNPKIYKGIDDCFVKNRIKMATANRLFLVFLASSKPVEQLHMLYSYEMSKIKARVYRGILKLKRE